jgi:hypothetical protein
MGLAAGLLIVTFIAVVGLAFGTARAVRGPGGGGPGGGRWDGWWDEGEWDDGDDPLHDAAPAEADATE